MFCNFFLSLKATTFLFSFRLKKSSLWSVDSNILDYRGFYVFRKTGAYDLAPAELNSSPLSHTVPSG